MNQKINNIFKGDKVIWMVFFFLCMISIIEVFSASSNLTYKSNNYIKPIMMHSSTIIAGVVVAILTLNIPCRYFKLMTPFLLFFSVFTLLLVLVAGEDINGAQRVIAIFGLTFQPSEIAKGSLVLATAQILSAKQTENGADRSAFKWILILTIPMAGLIMLENLSTAVLLCSVIFLMMFIGRVPMIQLGKLLGVVLGIGIAFFAFIMIVGHDTRKEQEKLNATETIVKTKEEKSSIEKLFHRADTWKGRIDKFMEDDKVEAKDYDLDKDGQVAHANIAIVSSNVIGRATPWSATFWRRLSQTSSLLS